MRARVPHAHADRLVIFPGAQTILFNLLAHLARPGDVVLTEAITFPGIKAAAAQLGVKLVGVAMDDGGMLPDALAKACRTHRPKAVYLIPTLHNPTTATLVPERRSAIAKIVRDADTMLIEDDAYGLLDRSASPIANLIPERTYLATTLSKCIAPALRVAYLLTPDSGCAAADARPSPGDRADAGTADGRAGDALARDRRRRPHHHRHPQRGRRPPATGAARIEGLSVPGEAGRASSVAAPAGGATGRRRASAAKWACDRCRRRLHRRRNLRHMRRAFHSARRATERN